MACLWFDVNMGLLYVLDLQKLSGAFFYVIISFNWLPCCQRVGKAWLQSTGTMCMFCPSLRGNAIHVLQAGMGGTDGFIGPAWPLPSFSWLKSLEAFHYFMGSVVSPISRHPSVSIPICRCMLNDVLISCHFRLSALESLAYTETCANTLLSVGMPTLYSAELPTISCYGHVYHVAIILKSHSYFCCFLLLTMPGRPSILFL